MKIALRTVVLLLLIAGSTSGIKVAQNSSSSNPTWQGIPVANVPLPSPAPPPTWPPQLA